MTVTLKDIFKKKETYDSVFFCMFCSVYSVFIVPAGTIQLP